PRFVAPGTPPLFDFTPIMRRLPARSTDNRTSRPSVHAWAAALATATSAPTLSEHGATALFPFVPTMVPPLIHFVTPSLVNSAKVPPLSVMVSRPSKVSPADGLTV